MGFQKCFLPPPPTSLSEVKLEFVGILFVAIIFHCTIENLIYVSCNLKQFSTIFGSLIGWGSSLNICKIYRRIGCKFLQPQYLKKKKNFIFCLRSSKTEIWLLSLLSPGRCQFNWNRISHSKRNSKTKIFENPEVIKLISLLRKRNTLTTNKQKKKRNVVLKSVRIKRMRKSRRKPIRNRDFCGNVPEPRHLTCVHPSRQGTPTDFGCSATLDLHPDETAHLPKIWTDYCFFSSPAPPLPFPLSFLFHFLLLSGIHSFVWPQHFCSLIRFIKI